jgi:PAS domain S-box-containing protein
LSTKDINSPRIRKPLQDENSFLENFSTLDPDTEGVRRILQNLQAQQVEEVLEKAELVNIREELQYLRDKLRVVYDMAPTGYLSLNSEGYIIEVNPALIEMLGINRQTLTGTPFTQYLTPSAQEIFLNHLRETLESDKRQSCEIQIIKGDQSTCYARMDSTAIHDTEGNFSQLLATICEITDRPRPDEPKNLQDTIIEVSCDAILATNRNLEITCWNKAAESTFGWQPVEVMGKQALLQVRTRLLEPLTRSEVMSSLTENGTWAGEIDCYRKDGTCFRSRVSIGIIWDDRGDFNGIVAIYHESDTKQGLPNGYEIEKVVKERTEDLVKANRILQQELNIHKQAALLAKESEGKNRDLVDNIKLGIFRCTPGSRGKFLEVNKAMEEITGYSRDELLQIDVCNLYTSTQEDQPFANEVNITDWKVTRELYLRRKDGAYLTVAVTIVAIRFDSGATQYFDGILEDITERKQAQEQINQSLQRLQKTIKEIIQAMAYIGEVRDPYTAGHQRRVAQISHEISQILGLDEEQREGLTMAAFVHDIGKILVPADILSKPGKLTKPEFDMLKDHTRIGYEILKTIEFPWPIANIVLQHHERVNGTGYPAGLSGEQIVIEARILAVADVVEAMSSHRPYRPALGIDKALEEIGQNRGILYDDQVVDACLKLFRERGFNLN